MSASAPRSPPAPRLWDPSVRHGGARAGAPPPDDGAPSPLREHRRMKQVKRLKSAMAKQCAQLGIPAPLLLYERWHARCSLLQDGAMAAVLLPCADDGGLARDLRRGGASEDGAAEAAEKLAEAGRAAAARLDASANDGAESDQVIVDDAGAALVLKLAASPKLYLRVNKAHVGKLRALWSRSTLGGKPLPPSGPKYDAFVAAVYCVLARYDALGGSGYQLALSGDAFDVLVEHLGVTCECFASPLNCRFGRYHSLWKETDSRFGSLGSFFTSKPTSGSFEANPPWMPEVLLAAAKHISACLDDAAAAKRALSFVVIVPAWHDVPMWRALQSSRHRKGPVLVLDAASHGYCDGSQHTRPAAERHRVSSYDTAVFFLQTDAAELQWPATKAVRQKLATAMGAAVGTAATLDELEVRYRGANGGKKRKRDV